jgi:hypothetical protein
LKNLIERKVSLARAAIILKRSQSTIQTQARKLGTPLPGVRAQKAAIRASIAEAETLADRLTCKTRNLISPGRSRRVHAIPTFGMSMT